jgi:hypothetical protein
MYSPVDFSWFASALLMAVFQRGVELIIISSLLDKYYLQPDSSV